MHWEDAILSSRNAVYEERQASKQLQNAGIQGSTGFCQNTQEWELGRYHGGLPGRVNFQANYTGITRKRPAKKQTNSRNKPMIIKKNLRRLFSIYTGPVVPDQSPQPHAAQCTLKERLPPGSPSLCVTQDTDSHAGSWHQPPSFSQRSLHFCSTFIFSLLFSGISRIWYLY